MHQAGPASPRARCARTAGGCSPSSPSSASAPGCSTAWSGPASRRTTSSPTTATSRRSTRRACRRPACPGSTHFGTPFGEWPALIPFAALTLPFLLLFRLTCYYYRKAYYRSFWISPPACAVPEAHRELLR